MNEAMSGAVALISGGASGIGFETAKLLKQRGASVWIGDVQDSLGESVAKDIGAHFLHLDVTKPEDWSAAVDAIQGQDDKLTHLVNNAGIGVSANLEEETLEGFMRTINVNLTGVFLGCKTAAPLMAASGGGAIVNVSSIFGIVSDPLAIAYSASKGGVRSMTKAIALDLHGRNTGIRVNSVHPGFVVTPLVSNAVSGMSESDAEKYTERTVGRTPMGMAEPEEIARAIAFLLSSDSSYMTGSELVVDGGFTAG